MEQFITYLGYVGAVLILLAYFMVSTGRWKARSIIFQGTNVLASVLLVSYALSIEAYPNLILNTAFLAIGLTTVLQIIRK